MPATTLFLDVGGVIVTNAWGHTARLRAARHFGLEIESFSLRHHQAFHLYEEGRMNLTEYLDAAVFYEERPFTRADFREFMMSESEALPEMVELLRKVKARHDVKIVAISNEGWELAAHRIEKFALKELVDLFIFSCFVRRRKPDPEIYQVALNVTQATAGSVVYIEENPMFVAAAENLNIHSITHIAVKFTRKALADVGLET
jgi:putative hydrolase of the HAD superfamily